LLFIKDKRADSAIVAQRKGPLAPALSIFASRGGRLLRCHMDERAGVCATTNSHFFRDAFLVAFRCETEGLAGDVPSSAEYPSSFSTSCGVTSNSVPFTRF
jgi:hypothetical protein